MARITVNNIREATGQTELFDIVNAIRNSASSFYKEFVPLADAENVAKVGAAIVAHEQTQNEFINALVNRIGLVIVRHVVLQNPLSRFKSGTLEMGASIQEIFTDLTKSHLYDTDVSENQVFKREIPNVHTLYHELNRKEFYKQTIEDIQLKQAFVSWEKFGSFTTTIIQALYNSAAVDEYKYMKLLLATYYANGHFKVVSLPSNYDDKDLIQKARAYATHMTLPQGSRNYNSLGVHTTTQSEDLLVLLTPEKEAAIDVNVLAAAFNMDKATFIGNRIILDSLGENPVTGEKIEMMLIDKSFFMVLDNELKMTSQYNPQGLYWNYWLHVWQVISASRFANAVAFVKNAEMPITEVVVSPAIRETKQNRDYIFNANIREVDGVEMDYTLQWKVYDQQTMQEIATATITPNPDNENEATFRALVDSPTNIVIEAIVSYGGSEPVEPDPEEPGETVAATPPTIVRGRALVVVTPNI